MASTTLPFNGFHGDFYSRRLLLQTQIQHSSNTAPPPPLNPSPPIQLTSNDNNSFDANVVMVLSVLLCALICSLGLNSIIRCALRCSRLVSNQSDTSNPSVRLANTGVKKKALKTFPTVTYSSDLNLPGLDTECAICLSEFCSGDKVRLLPKCNHGFHVKCIDKWLGSHSSCPTCRHCLLETCQKIVGCSSSNQGSSSDPGTPMEPVTLTPLEREGFIRSLAVTIPH